MGSVTTDKFVGREGAAPATPDTGTVALYFKADGKPYIKDDTGTEEALLTDSVSEGDKILADNTAGAWQIKEGANIYAGFSTTNTLEDLTFGFKTGLTTLKTTVTAGSRGMYLDSGGGVEIDATNALTIESSAGVIQLGGDDVDQNINIGTDGDRTITVGVTDGTTQTDLKAGTGGMNLVCATGQMDLSIKDDDAVSWLLHEGVRNYIKVVTTDGSEQMEFGNATTNPLFNFLGSGQVDFAGPVDMNAAFTGTGAYTYSQTVGTFTYNVAGAIYDIAACDQFQAIAGGGAADAIRLQASAGGGFDFDIGTNGWDVDSAGAMIFTGPDDEAAMWQVKEGANSYIKCVSTNASEAVELGEDVIALQDLTVDGLIVSKMAIASGPLVTHGGTTFIQDVASNVVTDSTAELLFNKEGTLFPINTLIPGRRLHIRAVGVCVDTDDGDQPLTLRIRLHHDTGPVDINIQTIVAADTADGDIWEMECWLSIRDGGTSSTRTFVSSGGSGIGQPNAFALDRQRLINAADFDETLTYKVQVTAQWTNAETANQVRMDDLFVELY